MAFKGFRNFVGNLSKRQYNKLSTNVPFIYSINGQLEVGSPSDVHDDIYMKKFNGQMYNSLLKGRINTSTQEVVVYGGGKTNLFIPLFSSALQALLDKKVIGSNWTVKWDTLGGVRKDNLSDLMHANREDLVARYEYTKSYGNAKELETSKWLDKLLDNGVKPWQLRAIDIKNAGKVPFTYAGRFGEGVFLA